MEKNLKSTDIFTNVKAKLFDFDGTLLDSKPALYKAYSSFMQNFQLEPNSTEFEELNGPSILEVCEILKNKYQIKESVKDLCEIYENFIQISYIEADAFDGASELLLAAKNKEWHSALVTSGARELCEAKVKNLGWSSYFDEMLFGDDVEKSKPHPEIYLRAIDALRISKENIVVLEDSINGVRAAAGAGLRVIGLRDENLLQHGATIVCSDLLEVKSLLF